VGQKVFEFVYSLKQISIMSKNYSGSELRVRRVQPGVLNEFNNIAANLGITSNTFARQKLGEIVKSYSEEMRKAPSRID
jgi:hypothetical protein